MENSTDILKKQTIFSKNFIEEISKDIESYSDTNLNYMEVSHRSQDFVTLTTELTEQIYKYYEIEDKDKYENLILQHGCLNSSLLMNFLNEGFGISIHSDVAEEITKAKLKNALIVQNEVKVEMLIKSWQTQVRDYVINCDKKFVIFFIDLVKSQKLIDFEDFKSILVKIKNENYTIPIYISLNFTGLVNITKYLQFLKTLSLQIIYCFNSGRGISINGCSSIVFPNKLIGQHFAHTPDMLNYSLYKSKASVINTPNTLAYLIMKKQLQKQNSLTKQEKNQMSVEK